MPLGLTWGITAWLVRAWHGGVAGVMKALHELSKHTGIPVVVIAAVLLVVSFRFARRAARLAVEIAVVLALLLGATQLGWIHW
jgi:hypothetical protein